METVEYYRSTKSSIYNLQLPGKDKKPSIQLAAAVYCKEATLGAVVNQKRVVNMYINAITHKRQQLTLGSYYSIRLIYYNNAGLRKLSKPLILPKRTIHTKVDNVFQVQKIDSNFYKGQLLTFIIETSVAQAPILKFLKYYTS